MCHRVNSDNSGRATGVSYYGPDGSDNTIEAEIVILAPFIYDNTRLLLLSKTAKFPNGLANSSGQVGKHIMAHIGAKVYRRLRQPLRQQLSWGPTRRSTASTISTPTITTTPALGFIRGSQVAVATANQEGGPIGTAMGMEPPPGVPRWGAAYRDFFAKYYARHAVIMSETENLPYADHTIDLDPDVRDAWGLPAPRITYDWRRPNERKARRLHPGQARGAGRAMGATQVWRAPLGGGAPGPHTQGGTRMGSDPKTSVVNRYSQSWDIPNLFIVGSSTHPSMSGFNPTLTIQALAYMSADAIVNRYRKSPARWRRTPRMGCRGWVSQALNPPYRERIVST